MITVAIIGGLLATAVGIGYKSGKNNKNGPAGEISNNPVSQWNDRQPYNP